MKFLLIALNLVLALNAFAADTTVVENGNTINFLTRPPETRLLQNSQQGKGVIVQDPQACSDRYGPCSTDNDCCGSLHCMKYGSGLYCNYN